MFGYVRPLQPEMKLVEYDVYQSVYCGLCRQLGHSFGPFARLTLSYDFVFLAMLALGFAKETPAISRRRCGVNPLHKKPCCHPCPELEMAGDVAMIMLYYKVKDNQKDRGFWGRVGAGCLLPFAGAARNAAARRQPEADNAIAKAVAAQDSLEAAGCDDLDMACDPTATALGTVFAGIGTDEQNRRVLQRLGYLMGRYVYMADALDDIEKDLQSGNYNPFVARYHLRAGDSEGIKEIITEVVPSLNGTVAEIGRAADLLQLQRMGPVIGNIVHMGLKNTVDMIVDAKAEKEGGK